MSVLLFEHPLSPYAQKVKLALMAKGIEFEAELPADLGSGAMSETFRQASPRGEVPALVHDGLRIFDSTIILEYIEDTWPEPPLLPADPGARARARMIEDVMDTHYEAINWALGELDFFGRGAGPLAEQLRRAAAEQIDRWQLWLTAQLADQPYFDGDRWGWTDIAVIPYLNGSAGFDMGPAPDSPLGRWFAAANARDDVQACAAAAQRVSFDTESEQSAAALSAVRQALEAGQFKREYRDHRLEWMIRSGGLQIVLDGLEKQNIRFTEPFA